MIFKQFLQAYGYQHLSTLHNLQRLEAFNVRDNLLNAVEPHLSDKLARVVQITPIQSYQKKMTFRKISQRLNLLSDESIVGLDVKSGQHPSYVYGGIYTPLIYR